MSCDEEIVTRSGDWVPGTEDLIVSEPAIL